MSTNPALTSVHPWCVVHPLTPEDKDAMLALRAMVEPNKGRMQGPAARPAFDAIMMRVAPPETVSYRQETIAGVQGWWCRPENVRPGATMLHLHGG